MRSLPLGGGMARIERNLMRGMGGRDRVILWRAILRFFLAHKHRRKQQSSQRIRHKSHVSKNVRQFHFDRNIRIVRWTNPSYVIRMATNAILFEEPMTNVNQIATIAEEHRWQAVTGRDAALD